MLSTLLASSEVTPPLASEAAAQAAAELSDAMGWQVYARSITGSHSLIFFLARRDTEKRLCLVWEKGPPPAPVGDFSGERATAELGEVRLDTQTGPLDHANAEALRKHLPFLSPQLVGVRPAIGTGDRLGLATPAHVRAVRGSGLRPVFAQQSIREMTRTARTPEHVMDSATFGVFEEGYRDGFGADADHLKTTADVDATVAVGFTMFTVDPGDHVDDRAESDGAAALQAKFEGLPWPELETTAEDVRRSYLGESIRLPSDLLVSFDEEALLRAVVKYGRALAHTVAMYRHLHDKMGGQPFELEMSVDETAVPTTVAEHVFVASELHRLGVKWVSLAPRFVGDFEKGVDYIGDLSAFEESFAQHVAVAQHFGPYKISIHSGSDKFSIYPIAARLAGELVHLKTAGTSYLEALRAIASVAPGLFREILAFAVERYPDDRASYHVSADLARVRPPEGLSDHELQSTLDQFDAREVLHVTFGSVLTAAAGGRPRFRNRIVDALATNEEAHYETVRAHIERHVRPFAAAR